MRASLFYFSLYVGCCFLVIIHVSSTIQQEESKVLGELLESVHALKMQDMNSEIEIRTLIKRLEIINKDINKQNKQILSMEEKINKPSTIAILKVGHLPEMNILSARSNSGSIYGFDPMEICARSVLDVFYPTENLRKSIELKIKRLKDLNEEGMVDKFKSTIQTFYGELVIVKVTVLKLSDGFLITTGEEQDA